MTNNITNYPSSAEWENHLPTFRDNEEIILTDEQQTRLNSVWKILSELTDWINKYWWFTEYRKLAEESFLNNPNNSMNPFQQQSVLQWIGKIRYIESILPYLSNEQKQILIKIESALIPMFIAITKAWINVWWLSAEQLNILDILSLSAITKEEKVLLEWLQNQIDINALDIDWAKEKLSEIKNKWTRFI